MKQQETHGHYTKGVFHAAVFVDILIIAACLMLAACVLTGCGELEVLQDWAGSGENAEEVGGKKVLIEDVPEWSGTPYIEINENVPEFTRSEIKRAKKAARKGRRYEVLTELDHRNRCGSVTVVVTPATMPTGERGSIGMIRPSGWKLDKYSFIDNGGYLYNRCHLVAWQLSGLNDEERNLITGTRYMNVEGMLPFENQVAQYVRGPDGADGGSGSGDAGGETTTGGENVGSGAGAQVLYRATPIFRGKELVARGVQLEAYSLEDSGKTLSFNVYCYNVQPGVSINYRNGKNKLDLATLPAGVEPGAADHDDPSDSDADASPRTDAGFDGGASSDTDGGAGKKDSVGSEGGADTDDGAGKEGSANTDGGAGSSDDEPDRNGGGNKSEYPSLDIPKGVTYILNTNTMRFHRLDCKGARTIREHNREWFYGTRKEAIDAGYVPCGMCEP